MVRKVFIHGVKCQDCGASDSAGFSQGQIKKMQADASFKPTCKVCTTAMEEKKKWAGNYNCDGCGRKRLVAAEFSQSQMNKVRADPSFVLSCLKCNKASGDTSVGGGGGESDEKTEVQEKETTKTVEFSAGKLGLSIEKNAVNKLPAADSQAGLLGIELGWVVAKVNGALVPCDKKEILARVGTESEKGAKPITFEFRVPMNDHHCCSECQVFQPRSLFTGTQLNNKGPGKQRCKICVGVEQGEEQRGSEQDRFVRLADARQATKVASASGSVMQKLMAATMECAIEAELVTGLKPVVLGKGRRGGGGGGKGGTASRK